MFVWKIVGEEMRLNKLGKIVQEELLRTAEIRGDDELDVYKNKTPRKARQYPQASGCPIIFSGIIVLTNRRANWHSPRVKSHNNPSNNL